MILCFFFTAFSIRELKKFFSGTKSSGMDSMGISRL